jgi:urease accessory protein
MLAERGLVSDAASLQEWIAVTLRWQVAPSDGVAAAAAWHAVDDLAEVAKIDGHLFATRLAREPREASERTGRQMLSTLTLLAGEPLISFRREVLARRTAGLQPVVLGLAGRALGIGRRETVLLLLHLYVSSCLGAALRLLDIDDVQVQQIRLNLAPLLAEAADEALAIPWKEMYACAVQSELMTMMHERATMRLFAS